MCHHTIVKYSNMRGLRGFLTVFMVLVGLGCRSHSIALMSDTEEQNNKYYPDTSIHPDDDRIVISGSKFIKYQEGELIIHRHSDNVYAGTTRSNLFNPLKARTSTGISIEFKTNSPETIAKFRIAKGMKKAPVFGVFRNNNYVRNARFDYEEGKEIMIKCKAKENGKYYRYKITFPIMTDIHFLGLELQEGYKLGRIEKKKKPIYIAFGNSITHGTGQKTTHQTYPYILAKKMGWDLYNIAVAGGKTSKVLAEMVRDEFEHVDVMTLLIGFNDYNGEGIDTMTYRQRYHAVINAIREKHHNAKLYCISLTTTLFPNSKTSGIPAADFRKVVKNVVVERQNRGDKAIFFIDGESITEEKDLNDKVHLNVAGAKNFAHNLSKLVQSAGIYPPKKKR